MTVGRHMRNHEVVIVNSRGWSAELGEARNPRTTPPERLNPKGVTVFRRPCRGSNLVFTTDPGVAPPAKNLGPVGADKNNRNVK